MMCLWHANSHAFTVTSSDGTTTQTETSIGINNPSYTEISAFSYGDSTTFSQDFSISETEMIWLKQFMAHQSFDASPNTVYLLPIKLYNVCLISTNEEGVFLKVHNLDFTGTKATNAPIRTYVEVVGNGSAPHSTGSTNLLFVSSDARNNISNQAIKFFDKRHFSSDASINTSQALGDSLSDNSPLTNATITTTSHARVVATDTMQAFNHYGMIEGQVLASSNRRPSTNRSATNFAFNESDFAANTCGDNNSAVVKFALYANIKDLMDAQNDTFTTSASLALCKNSTCGAS
tara:strand:- start:426 stop:1298 length:873 start_codon:yes stop_codon:yes gene_type:complete